MTIQYHQLSEADYKTKRYNTLLQFEESGIPKLTAYRDSAGYPTIGVGFKIDSNWDAILTMMGFKIPAPEGSAEQTYISLIEALIPPNSNKTFTDSEMATLNTQLNTIMQARYDYYVSIGDNTKRQTFSFTDSAEVQTTFNTIVDDATNGYEKTLNSWLATKGLTAPDSNERVALLSLVYNNIIGFNKDGTAKSPNLLNDLKNGDRLAAWYEISYHSNGDGQHANRRYQEAALFGMWDSGNPTTTELQNVETFLNTSDPYKTTESTLQYMRDYEATYPPSNAGIGTIDDEINDNVTIKNYFISEYAPQGATIDGRVLICAELDSDVISTTTDLTTSQIKSGYLKSTDKNDLIIGGEGNDKIDGGKGNDTMTGGAGKILSERLNFIKPLLEGGAFL